MQILTPNLPFPPVETADEHGLLAIGGELSVKRLKEAYSLGIFPWYDVSQPVLWWSPNPRMVLFPQKLRISKSMRQLLKKDVFKVTFNQDFEAIISACSTVKREGQEATWITPEMKKTYKQLHHEGLAHSVEVWQNNKIVGGLYGIWLHEKQVFCGESMFSNVSNSSKFGFIKLVEKLESEGVKLIDCQVYTSHLESLGAEEIPRKDFLKFLE